MGDRDARSQFVHLSVGSPQSTQRVVGVKMARDMFDQALMAEGITGQLADLARSIYMQESGGRQEYQDLQCRCTGWYAGYPYYL